MPWNWIWQIDMRDLKNEGVLFDDCLKKTYENMLLNLKCNLERPKKGGYRFWGKIPSKFSRGEKPSALICGYLMLEKKKTALWGIICRDATWVWCLAYFTGRHSRRGSTRLSGPLLLMTKFSKNINVRIWHTNEFVFGSITLLFRVAGVARPYRGGSLRSS